jgi:hypothetical protein
MRCVPRAKRQPEIGPEMRHRNASRMDPTAAFPPRQAIVTCSEMPSTNFRKC